MTGNIGSTRRLVLILATLVLATTAGAAEMRVLWDQSDFDAAAAGLPDAAAGCEPGTETVHQASDVRLARPSSITRITTFYTDDTPVSFGAVAEAWLWIAPKRRGLPPPPAGESGRGGRLVTATARHVEGHFELVADNLDIPLQAGDYWLALTPVVPIGPVETQYRRCTVSRFGEPPLAWRPCTGGSAGWTSSESAADVALRVEGYAAPISDADVSGSQWRWLR